MAEDKFIFRMIARKAFAGFILPHSSLRGCRCAFWGVVTFNPFLTFDFEGIIDLNYWRGISLASALLLPYTLQVQHPALLSLVLFNVYQDRIYFYWDQISAEKILTCIIPHA